MLWRFCMYYNPNNDYLDGINDMMTDLSSYTHPKNYQKGLELIRNTLGGERKDELFYNYLVSVAPTEEANQIVSSIRDDEIRHNKMFRTIYYQLTGQVLPHGLDEPFDKPKSYCEGLKQALMGELSAVQKYRQILFAMENRVHINMLTEIITDELRHSGLYNLLMTLGNCF
ncbi:ferritin-like domain-containing protein [Mycoplasmatota bacterium]|nr:ferritin-like domain-containing protein [Mycoplasmatota bacterium]